jgi:hypothetical protein
MTKAYKCLWIFLTALSFLFVFGPLAVFSYMGFATASVVGQCALLSCLTVGSILSAVCAVNKYTPRSRMFIFLLGFYFALEHFLPIFIVLGTFTALDEFIICPLKKHYHNLYTINREIDKRGI